MLFHPPLLATSTMQSSSLFLQHNKYPRITQLTSYITKISNNQSCCKIWHSSVFVHISIQHSTTYHHSVKCQNISVTHLAIHYSHSNLQSVTQIKQYICTSSLFQFSLSMAITWFTICLFKSVLPWLLEIHEVHLLNYLYPTLLIIPIS